MIDFNEKTKFEFPNDLALPISKTLSRNADESLLLSKIKTEVHDTYVKIIKDGSINYGEIRNYQSCVEEYWSFIIGMLKSKQFVDKPDKFKTLINFVEDKFLEVNQLLMPASEDEKVFRERLFKQQKSEGFINQSWIKYRFQLYEVARVVLFNLVKGFNVLINDMGLGIKP